jgi:hypothetical protein
MVHSNVHEAASTSAGTWMALGKAGRNLKGSGEGKAGRVPTIGRGVVRI